MCTENVEVNAGASGLSSPKPLDCSAFRVDKASNGYFVSNGKPFGGYVHRDFSVNQSMSGKNGFAPNYFATKGEAEQHLLKFQQICSVKSGQKSSISDPQAFGVGSQKSPFIPRKATNQFLIDHDKGGVEQLFSVRLVHQDETDDFENALKTVTLEIATPHSGEEFTPLARLEFKGGRVVMYREKNAFDPYIETDEEGRIQN